MNRKITQGVLVALGMIGTASAGTTAAITCADCKDITALHTAAHNWFYNSSYVPSTLVVVSQNVFITGIFHAHLVCAKRCILGVYRDAMTSTNDSAAYLDNLMFARASKHQRPVPMTSTWNSIESTVSLQVENQLVFTGSAGFQPYHWLLGFGSVYYYTYFDKVWGAPFDNFVGDMITVTYPGGFSEKFQFQGADKSPANRWKRVPGTLMLNGKPYSVPTNAFGRPAPGYQEASGPNLWGPPGRVLTELDLGSCSGVSSITVTLDNTSLTSTGFFAFPC